MHINWVYAAHPSFRWFPEKAWQIEAVAEADQEVAELRGTLKRLQNATRREPGMVSHIMICLPLPISLLQKCHAL